MILLDTEVVWELRGGKAGRSDPAVVAWAQAQPRTGMFVSALSLAEFASAAGQIERSDKAAAAAIRRWADGAVIAAFDGRVLSVDGAVARRAGSLAYPAMRDGLVAATALEHGLTLATRRPADFRSGKVRLVNPWGYAPDAAEEEMDWRQLSRGGPVWLKSLFVRG
ncbi:hypothetical protein GCM10011380_17550 [Sphingomonas metalli]|uniref:Ribonuclease VapC n=1 Tax=Sphingomonas metalli TaxID=1779358 RepID=A0A916T329_9SPHN|nr:PIN domain-containing protein [Sphingomonas metalli]GGB28434.1 hypothetical protein GCM10011380_17550 [Sphingomonas metalli]